MLSRLAAYWMRKRPFSFPAVVAETTCQPKHCVASLASRTVATFLNITFLNNATTKRPARHLCLFPPNNRTPEQLHRVILDSKRFLLIEGQRGKKPIIHRNRIRCSVTFYVCDHTLQVGGSSGKMSYVTSLLWYVSYLLFFFV